MDETKTSGIAKLLLEEALRANLEGNTEISETGLMDIVDRAALQKKKQQEEEDEVLRSF